jgi:serine/threonine protein kinase
VRFNKHTGRLVPGEASGERANPMVRLPEVAARRDRAGEFTSGSVSDDFPSRLRDDQELHAMSAPSRSQIGGSNSDDGPAVAVEPPMVDALFPGLAEHPDYELISELGRGGMGVVYFVRNKLMGRLEVLKVVGGRAAERPGARDRFLRDCT